jgi:glycerate kinase
MKIVIAPDSFKGSLSAMEVAEAIAAGARVVFPESEIVNVPMADGGEGTVDVLVSNTGGQLISHRVTNPLGKKVTAAFGLLGDQETAIIEMAAASGLQYVSKESANPAVTTTYGTGELILAALDAGTKTVIIGLGGSATNDGGAGMAQALGYRLLDAEHKELPWGGVALKRLAQIDDSRVDQRVKTVKIIVASDVTNPLIGPTGASVVFGPQKGATPELVAELDEALAHYAMVLAEILGKDVAKTPGAGAAGGLGAGLLAFTPAKITSGVDIVMDVIGLAEKVKDADVVVIGEGSLDSQTPFGKAPSGVTRLVRQVAPSAKIIGLAGNVITDATPLYDMGVDSVFSVVPGVESLEKAISDASANITGTSINVFRPLK